MHRFNIFPRTLNQCTDHMARRNWSKQEYIYIHLHHFKEFHKQ